MGVGGDREGGGGAGGCYARCVSWLKIVLTYMISCVPKNCNFAGDSLKKRRIGTLLSFSPCNINDVCKRFW